MSDGVRRAAEDILATVVFIRDRNGEVVIQSRCWLWAREVAQAYLAQQREEPLVHPSVESPSHRLIAETKEKPASRSKE